MLGQNHAERRLAISLDGFRLGRYSITIGTAEHSLSYLAVSLNFRKHFCGKCAERFSGKMLVQGFKQLHRLHRTSQVILKIRGDSVASRLNILPQVEVDIFSRPQKNYQRSALGEGADVYFATLRERAGHPSKPAFLESDRNRNATIHDHEDPARTVLPQFVPEICLSRPKKRSKVQRPPSRRRALSLSCGMRSLPDTVITPSHRDSIGYLLYVEPKGRQPCTRCAT